MPSKSNGQAEDDSRINPRGGTHNPHPLPEPKPFARPIPFLYSPDPSSRVLVSALLLFFRVCKIGLGLGFLSLFPPNGFFKRPDTRPRNPILRWQCLTQEAQSPDGVPRPEAQFRSVPALGVSEAEEQHRTEGIQRGPSQSRQ